MKALIMALWTGAAAGILLPPAVAAAAGEKNQPPLKFNFELNHPLLYSVETKMTTVMDNSVQLETGNKTTLTKNASTTRYKFRLTPVRKLADGIWTLHYEPLDLEQEVEYNANSSHVVTTIHGLNVKSTQNGILVVDSAKDIGTSQAKTLKQAIYPKMLSGYVDFRPNGDLAKVDGDLPFIDVWKDVKKYQIGLFDIVLPTNSVGSNGTWTVNVAVKNMEAIKLGDDGIVETNQFAIVSEAPPAGGQVVSFDLSLALNCKDMTASMDSMGQSTTLSIPEFNINKTGRFDFDTHLGCLLGGHEESRMKYSSDVLIQGHSASITMDTEMNVKFQLLKDQP